MAWLTHRGGFITSENKGNGCSVCARRIRDGDVRFVLSSRERGGSSLPLSHRLACKACHKKALARGHVAADGNGILLLRMSVKSALAERIMMEGSVLEYAMRALK